MSLPNITFLKGQGGLGRPLTGQDFISALLFFTGSLPTGFTSYARVKALYQPDDAIAAGIKNDYSDATASTATYLITTAGATGDKINISVSVIDGTGKATTVDLGTYTKLSTDTTIALLGASIAAFINAGTYTHGWTASFLTATLTLTAPKKYGVYLNSGTPYVVTITGTIAGTLTQNVVAGVASLQAVWYYHISEFFRLQPGGILYVGFYAVPGTYDFAEVTLMQNFSNGTIRQIGVYKDGAAFATADLTALDIVCKVNDEAHKPISSIYVGNLAAVTDISTLADLNSLSANKAMSCIAQDGGGQGNFLWLTTGKTISVLGAQLGAAALSKVSESIAWVAKFDMSNGTELEVLAFGNGKLFSDSSISDSLLSSLNDKRYVFLRKFVGESGSFFNDSHCAIIATSDYAYLENNRTIDKAIRGIYSSMLPSLNGPLQLNANGTLAETTVAYLEDQADLNLAQMIRDGELSARSVVINPAQNVLTTSKIIITVTLVINGVARQIEIPIGFKPSIA